MADNGEDYGIQQGNGDNERVTTLETQMPQLSLTDVAVFKIEWSKRTGITRLYFHRNLFFYTRPSPAIRRTPFPFIPSWLSFTTNAFDQPTYHP